MLRRLIGRSDIKVTASAVSGTWIEPGSSCPEFEVMSSE